MFSFPVCARSTAETGRVDIFLAYTLVRARFASEGQIVYAWILVNVDLVGPAAIAKTEGCPVQVDLVERDLVAITPEKLRDTGLHFGDEVRSQCRL